MIPQLAASDKDAAKKLADEMLQKLRSEDLKKPGESRSAAYMLLMVALGKNQQKDGNDQDGSGPALFDDVTIGQLMNMVLDAMMPAPGVKPKAAEDSDETDGDNDDESLLEEFQGILPEVQKYAPSRYAALKASLDEMNKSQSPRERESAEFMRLTQTGSVDEM